MLHNINALYLHRVFHGIRFKVNNEDWLSVKMAFFILSPSFFIESCSHEAIIIYICFWQIAFKYSINMT